MKKTLLTIAFNLFIVAGVMAQNYVVWPATTASRITATNSSASTAISTGNVVGENQTVSSGFTVRDYNSNSPLHTGLQRFYPHDGTAAVSWGSETAINEGRYTEFSLSPTTGNSFSFNSFSALLGGGGTTSIVAYVYYSTDNFATRTLITGPEALPQVSTTTPVEMKSVAINLPAPVTINSGQNLKIRIYPYYVGAASTSKYLYVREVRVSDGIALPLDITSFTAKSGLSNQIKLDWKTVNEVNTKNFVVERRSNGGSFSSIGSVESKNTAGEHSYSFTDHAPLAGTNYYRLLQVDNDGKSKYSITTVSAEGKGGVAVSVFPSPATGSSVTVSYPSSSTDATLKVVTLGGAQVAKQTAEAGSTSSSVDISGLAAGYYLVIYSNGKDEKSVKFVKQ